MSSNFYVFCGVCIERIPKIEIVTKQFWKSFLLILLFFDFMMYVCLSKFL